MVYTFGDRLNFEKETIKWDKIKKKYYCYCCNKYIMKVYEHMALNSHTINYEELLRNMEDDQ